MEEIALVKKLTSKKGVSPILAALLLIVIAVAAAVITYAWVTTFTTTQTTTAGKAIKYDSKFINATSDMVTYSLSVDAVVTITVNGTDAGVDFSAGSSYKVKVAGPGVEWEDSVEAS